MSRLPLLLVPVVLALIAAAEMPALEPNTNEPKPGEEREFEIASGVKMVFCWVPPGECQLGSPKEEQDYIIKRYFDGERPKWLDEESESHRGKFKTSGFWLGKYPVTQSEWKAVMGDNPSEFNGKKDNRARGMNTEHFPVEQVSWNDCQEFLKKINKQAEIAKVFGKFDRFGLPHEDQWEYACRGGKGNKQPFYWGDTLNGTQANCFGGSSYGMTKDGPYKKRTCSVDFTNGGEYEKHLWGLCHMSGNVRQWCENKENHDGTARAIRGGSWNSGGVLCRSASRHAESPGFRDDFIGIRVAVVSTDK